MPMKCDFHVWENGYILLRDSPYMAKTDSDGEFTIRNLPYGTHTFKLWHERIGFLKDVLISKQKVEKGQVSISVNKASNNLGTIAVPENLFK